MDSGLWRPKLLRSDGLQREDVRTQLQLACSLFFPPKVPGSPSTQIPGTSTPARSEVLAEGQAEGRTWRALC